MAIITKKLLKGAGFLNQVKKRLRKTKRYTKNTRKELTKINYSDILREDFDMMKKFIHQNSVELNNNTFLIYKEDASLINSEITYKDKIKIKIDKNSDYNIKRFDKYYEIENYNNNNIKFDNLFYMVIYFINKDMVFQVPNLTEINNNSYNKKNLCDFIKKYVNFDDNKLFPYNVINPTLYEFKFPQEKLISVDDKNLKIIIHKIKHNNPKHKIINKYYFELTLIGEQNYLFFVSINNEGYPTKYPITYNKILKTYNIINNIEEDTDTLNVYEQICKYDSKFKFPTENNNNIFNTYNFYNLKDLQDNLTDNIITPLFPRDNYLVKSKNKIKYDNEKYYKKFGDLFPKINKPIMPTTTKLRQSTKKTKRSSQLKKRIQQTQEDNTILNFSEKYASYIHKIQRIDAEQLLKTQSGFHGSYLFRTGNNNKNIVLSLYNKSENKIYNYLLTIKNEKLSFIDKNGKEFIGNFEEIIDYMFKNVKPEPIYVNVERT